VIDFNDLNVTIGDQKRIHCNWCQVRTNHQLEAYRRSPAERFWLATMEVMDEVEDDNEYVEFRLWFCKGCDTGVMEVVYNEGEPQVPFAEFHPPRERHRVTVKSYRRLPKELAAIYKEVISSFNHELNLLCAVGLRALLEGVCQQKGIKGQNADSGENDHLFRMMPITQTG
jgi:hypothetical protein